MQGKDPFLALLGVFILSMTFFFCGEGAVTSPPPVALEHPAEIPPPAPNIIAPPPSAPAVLKKQIDDLPIGNTTAFQINSATLLPDEKPVLNRVAAMVHEDPTVAFEVGSHTDNVGPEHANRVFSEQRAKAVAEYPASKGSRMFGSWKCWLWTVVGAGFLGWGIKGLMLGPVMDEKRREVERLKSKVIMLTNQPPEVRTVEKRVEVPVERVVLKRVEVPVEKVVDRPVDNPEQLARIKALEGEVAVIAGLFTQIAQLKPFSSQAGERRSEGRVLVPIDNPEQLARIKALEAQVAVITDLRAQMTELRAVLLEVCEGVVEKRIVTPTEQYGDVLVDNPEKLARIKAVESEVAMIAELRARIAELLATSLQANEQVVEKRIETPAEQIIVQNGQAPVETISAHTGDLAHTGAIAPSDEGQAGRESPDDLKHIRGVGPALERFLHKRGVFWFSQVATWSQADIDKFEFLLPNFGGRIQRENWVRSAQVEYYKKYKQWLGDGEPPSESLDVRAQMAELPVVSSQEGEQVVEKRIETPAEQIVEQNGNVPVETISAHTGDLAHTGAIAPSDEGHAVGELPDDLKHIRGVGPALERFLHKRGVFWFSQVATWSQADIDKFEFLLPNFSGRIQRENWVRSAQVEYYKKYKQWLGEGEPSSTSPEAH